MQCLTDFSENFGKIDNVTMTAPGIGLHCYQILTEEYEPKDLSMKSSKKLKPIPPPLSLDARLSRNTLKEFANIATSPKSPLMQKNLPFRKRAHSLSYTGDSPQQSPVNVAAPVENSSLQLREEELPLSRYTPGTLISHVNPLISPNDLSVLDSPRNQPLQTWSTIMSSVQLSPAPSSLGSSHEELSIAVAASPWPSTAWHCFQSGVLVKVDTPVGGTGGSWKVSDELAQGLLLGPDWPQLLRLEGVQDSESGVVLNFACLGSCSGGAVRWEGDLVAQCHTEHVFYVRDKGWSAVYPYRVFKTYGKICQSIELGDICMPAPKSTVLSPDICDQFQRFSFPPEDLQTRPALVQPHMPLSPPVSPTKKSKDPDRPKRPMNAFMLFAQRYRPKLIQMHPGKDNRAISVILGSAWRSLSLVEQEVYKSEANCLAEEQKRRHPDCWKRKRSHSTS